MTTVLFDDFYGPLDRTLWLTTYSNGGRDQLSTGQVQWYADSQVEIDADPAVAPVGVCSLVARPAVAADNVPAGHTWASGILTSKATFLYGCVRVRAQVPKGPGLWPAICLFDPGAWPPEVDILEVNGATPDVASLTYHWTETVVGNQQTGVAQPVSGQSDGFHVYQLDWQPNLLVWSIDGVPQFAQTQAPNAPMNLTIDHAVGGVDSWVGPTTSATPTRAPFRIDTVEITQ